MRQGKLLIVDDNTDLTLIMARRFRSQGYAVVTGSDGDQALSLFERERPDILLLDMQMPGLDGAAVLNEIRKIDRDLDIIIMSGDIHAAQARMAIVGGACDCVAKPFDMEYLDLSISTRMLLRCGPPAPTDAPLF
jgi:DNA-binding NtrC family response regulator